MTEHKIIFILFVITNQLTCPGKSIENHEMMFYGFGRFDESRCIFRPQMTLRDVLKMFQG